MLSRLFYAEDKHLSDSIIMEPNKEDEKFNETFWLRRFTIKNFTIQNREFSANFQTHQSITSNGKDNSSDMIRQVKFTVYFMCLTSID